MASTNPSHRVHLMRGDGKAVVCGIPVAQADAEYAPDAPDCEKCGPR
jgi:hypothetical protein